MAQRFLAGFHPGFGTMGIWLSQPGIDVTQAGPAANFIMRPDFKVEQIIMSGAIMATPGQWVSVAYPADLAQRPYVWLHGNVGSNVEYPSDLGAAGGTGANPVEINFTATIWNNKIEFYNPNSQYNLWGFFMIFNRGIGA